MEEGFRHGHGLKRVLRHLQERHCWLAKDAHVFFLAGDWRHDVIRWVTQQQQQKDRRGGRPVAPQGFKAQAPRNWAQLSDALTSKRQFLERTVSAPQGGARSTNLFCVFGAEEQGIPLRRSEAGVGDVAALPFTVAEAASCIRHQRHELSGGNSVELSTCVRAAGQALTGDNVGGHASLHELRSTFLPRQAVDLLAVDLLGAAAVGTAPAQSFMAIQTRESLVNAMALGAHLLRPSGALLLRFPLSVRLQDKRVTASVRQYMRWSFQSSACEVDGDHLYCVGCRHTTEHPITAGARTPVPGLAQRSVPRPRRWNPRKGTDRGFFAALMPSFTDAPLVKEPLRRAIEEEARASRKVEEEADILLRVSLGMVERGAHHSKRDD
ncbi:uncharacterized protein Tco025E_07620 [Trypanosoma conorhini]|uniref:Methyltransferase n=1 Tax=Trypanosoma conorhini TaxID=83891 RepID=A0A422NL80_9TRYP|nr:uncharacterized protein Tco025E_07620 [Trypanosoma conorhini]RNF06247.1 hypothetical protein Tco025E_07620 [Trypanosoma conorhini]